MLESAIFPISNTTRGSRLLDLEREPIPATLVSGSGFQFGAVSVYEEGTSSFWEGRAMKALKLLGLGAMSLTLAVIGCAGTGQSDKRLSNADVSLISFGSLHGEVAECG